MCIYYGIYFAWQRNVSICSYKALQREFRRRSYRMWPVASTHKGFLSLSLTGNIYCDRTCTGTASIDLIPNRVWSCLFPENSGCQCDKSWNLPRAIPIEVKSWLMEAGTEESECVWVGANRKLKWLEAIMTLWHDQNGQHFAGDVLKHISREKIFGFWLEFYRILLLTV